MATFVGVTERGDPVNAKPEREAPTDSTGGMKETEFSKNPWICPGSRENSILRCKMYYNCRVLKGPGVFKGRGKLGNPKDS